MKITIDCREHDLYSKIETMDVDPGVEIVKENLPLGDILFQRTNAGGEVCDVLLIERKSIADLIASIKDGRYKEQSFRLLNSVAIVPHNIVYVIEGATSSLPPPTKKMVYGAITSLAFFKGFSVLRTWSVGETADLILNMARKIEKDWAEFPRAPSILPKNNVIEGSIEGGDAQTEVQVVAPAVEQQSQPQYTHAIKKVKKDNITAENIGEIMLAQIPGVGAQPAIEIMKQYKTIAGLVNALRVDPHCLDGFQVEGAGGKKRRMNSTAVAKICEYFGSA